ncbi:uncharacterized protein JCM15063_004254 [Sporobolomyces koalae]|uniref:uncharacterized protein n=1 Tax=Sporobolomyces koalae TaxID=500713 RepID=UPI00316B871B
MFPSLTDAQSRRGRTGIDAAVAQGGIYASIKGRLEELVTEQEREDNEDSFRWWKKLVRPYNKLSRPGQAPVRRQAVATIDSCIRDEFDQYLRDQGGSEQDTDDADLDTEASISQRADGIVECECCYTNVTASADSTITCSAASPHSFCRGCIVSLASSYAFGQSALSLPLLDSSPPNLGIPCPSTSICGAAFSVFALRRFLPSATLSALSRAARVQQVEQVLRDLPPDTVTAQCPECLYTELAEPAPNPLLLLLPLYSSPLEVPFDPLQLLEYTASTIIGFASFLLLNIVAIVIVVFFPNRKTGALYSSYFASTPLSIARDRASLLELLVADFDSPISSTRVLALKPHLLPHTRPHRIPIVALEWVKALTESHFCQHFTRPGQDCDECTKCMLYKEPDEKALVRSAICAARDRWIAEHPQQASELEGVDLGPIFAGVRDVVPKLSGKVHSADLAVITRGLIVSSTTATVAEKLTTGFELLALKLLALSVRPR